MDVKFPSFSEYQAALQNPQFCFRHYPLNKGSIEVDLWGLPRVRSGGFALTYKMLDKTKKMAVRCFYRNVIDRMQRYFEISKFINEIQADWLIPVRYLTRGIHIQGRFYPITYMDWVEGNTLDEWLIKNYSKREKVLGFIDEFLRIVKELEGLGAAHGDLSHRNIIINGMHAVLIDYDGMFVPGLAGRNACEIGNPYFQHPGRKSDFFNGDIDRFSSIVIYLALISIAYKPQLFRQFETGGEGLLFTKKDFQNPFQSALLREIEKIPELKTLVQNFRGICLSHVSQTPRLEDFLFQDSYEPLRFENNGFADDETELHPIFEAGKRKEILQNQGNIITVIGKITEVFWGKRKEGEPHVFLNFGNWRTKCFTVVLWDEPLRDFLTDGSAPESLKEKWVSVTGLLTSYNYRPQISLVSLSELVVLKDGSEAAHRLGIEPGTLVGSEDREKMASQFFEKNMQEDQPEIAGLKDEKQLLGSGALDQSDMVISRINQLFSTEDKPAGKQE